jgi:hypothetical protein
MDLVLVVTKRNVRIVMTRLALKGKREKSAPDGNSEKNSISLKSNFFSQEPANPRFIIVNLGKAHVNAPHLWVKLRGAPRHSIQVCTSIGGCSSSGITVL